MVIPPGAALLALARAASVACFVVWAWAHARPWSRGVAAMALQWLAAWVPCCGVVQHGMVQMGGDRYTYIPDIAFVPLVALCLAYMVDGTQRLEAEQGGGSGGSGRSEIVSGNGGGSGGGGGIVNGSVSGGKSGGSGAGSKGDGDGGALAPLAPSTLERCLALVRRVLQLAMPCMMVTVATWSCVRISPANLLLWRSVTSPLHSLLSALLHCYTLMPPL